MKKYNIGLAFLRVWMCFEVVICHFKNWGDVQIKDLMLPFQFIYNFREIAVPVFMLMSFSLTNIEEISKDNKLIRCRMHRLLIPQLVWSIAYFVVYWLLDVIYDLDLLKGFSDLWWQLFLGHSINQTAWYQIELILLTVTFVSAFRLMGGKGGKWFVIIFGICALYFQYAGINGALFDNIIWTGNFNSGYITYPIGRFVEMIPYAVAGIFVCYFNLFERLEPYKKEIIVSAVSLIYIFMNYEVFDEPLGYGYSGLYKLAIGILVVFLFYYLPFDKLPQVFRKIIKEISKYTMGIYFGHRMVGTIIYNSKLHEYLKMEPGSIYDCMVIFLICFIIAFMIHKVPFRWIKESIS